jgi:UDP-N-acetylmuramate dehydrogenase
MRSEILPDNQNLVEKSIIENVPLAQFTTLGIGGAAKYFIEVTSSEMLAAAVSWAHQHHLPLFILGGGSNVVIADEGFAGLVIHLGIGGIESRIENHRAIVKAGAGVEWDAFVALCVTNHWAGVECLSGIPGKVGATPIQNVGAYGQEVSETIVAVEAYDTESQSLVELSASQCQFAYRASRFKLQDRNRFIVTRVTYQFAVNGKPSIRYSDLQKYFAEEIINSVSLKEVREAVLTIRRRKAMVLDAYDTDSRSVGSFFVNPVVTGAELEEVKQRASQFVPDAREIPAFAAAGGQVKLSAAWLIERAGIHRGYVYGNVGTSTKHSLAIINRGGGSAREVLELCKKIQTQVMNAFGIALHPEPVFIGFEAP